MIEASTGPGESSRWQSGGALSLLLALLAIGAVLYFLLKSSGGTHTDAGNAMSCEPQIAKLVRETGGIGPEAQAAYKALPAECRKLLPDPASLAPSPERAPET